MVPPPPPPPPFSLPHLSLYPFFSSWKKQEGRGVRGHDRAGRGHPLAIATDEERGVGVLVMCVKNCRIAHAEAHGVSLGIALGILVIPGLASTVNLIGQ